MKGFWLLESLSGAQGWCCWPGKDGRGPEPPEDWLLGWEEVGICPEELIIIVII
jgi:hypothetical protein